jgi:hypothetical protein
MEELEEGVQIDLHPLKVIARSTAWTGSVAAILAAAWDFMVWGVLA